MGESIQSYENNLSKASQPVLTNSKMPRDLKERSGDAMPPLTKSPDPVDEQTPGGIEDEGTLRDILSQRNEKRDELHPYTQTLKLSDIESCILVEDETFPPQERCTREKVSHSTISRNERKMTPTCLGDMLVIHFCRMRCLILPFSCCVLLMPSLRRAT